MALPQYQQQDSVDYCRCTYCGENKKHTAMNFYKSFSSVYKSTNENRMTVCKDCVETLYNNLVIQYVDEVKALHELCIMLDMLYVFKVYDTARMKAEKDDNQKREKHLTIMKEYIKMIVSLPQYKGKTFKDSEIFDASAISSTVQSDTLQFWGAGFAKTDYDFLEDEYSRMLNRYECDSYVQEITFKEICLQQLDIRKKRQGGVDVDKELKTLQSLFKTAGIDPSQEKASLENSKVTFGTLIKKIENV